VFLLPGLRPAILHGRLDGVSGHFGPDLRAHPCLSQHVGIRVAEDMRSNLHWRIKPAQPRPLARLGYQRKSVQSVNEILEVYY